MFRLLIATACLPLLVACQSHSISSASSERVKGQLTASIDGWQIQSCEGKSYPLNLHSNDALSQALELLTEKETLQIDTSVQADDSRYQVDKLYRLANEANLCAEQAFRKLDISASGNEPFWHVRVSKEGMVITRPDQAPMALPYLEEQLPDGRLYLTSQANHQNVSLSLTPVLCQDDMSGAITHLRAHFSIDGQQLTGCAYVGGARD